MTTTDIDFFWKKAKEVGFEDTDGETVQILYNAVYDALHGISQEILNDMDGENAKYQIEEGFLIFDYGVIIPDYTINISYLLNQFGFKLYYDREIDRYKIFTRK